MGINGERVYPIENQTGSIDVVKEIDNKKKYFMKLIWKVVIGKWWQNKSHDKVWNSPPYTEIGSGRWYLWEH